MYAGTVMAAVLSKISFARDVQLKQTLFNSSCLFPSALHLHMRRHAFCVPFLRITLSRVTAACRVRRPIADVSVNRGRLCIQ